MSNEVSYLELYLSTDPSSPYFFGDKSIVIHSMNTTRLTCANFMMVSSGSTASTGMPSPTSSGATMYTGAASHEFDAATVVKGGLLALLTSLSCRSEHLAKPEQI